MRSVCNRVHDSNPELVSPPRIRGYADRCTSAHACGSSARSRPRAPCSSAHLGTAACPRGHRPSRGDGRGRQTKWILVSGTRRGTPRSSCESGAIGAGRSRASRSRVPSTPRPALAHRSRFSPRVREYRTLSASERAFGTRAKRPATDQTSFGGRAPRGSGSARSRTAFARNSLRARAPASARLGVGPDSRTTSAFSHAGKSDRVLPRRALVGSRDDGSRRTIRTMTHVRPPRWNDPLPCVRPI